MADSSIKMILVKKKNPWTYKNGAVAITDEEGTGDNDFNFTNGYQLEDNLNRVVVMYDGHMIESRWKIWKRDRRLLQRCAEEGVSVKTIYLLPYTSPLHTCVLIDVQNNLYTVLLKFRFL